MRESLPQIPGNFQSFPPVPILFPIAHKGIFHSRLPPELPFDWITEHRLYIAKDRAQPSKGRWRWLA